MSEATAAVLAAVVAVAALVGALTAARARRRRREPAVPHRTPATREIRRDAYDRFLRAVDDAMRVHRLYLTWEQHEEARAAILNLADACADLDAVAPDVDDIRLKARCVLEYVMEHHTLASDHLTADDARYAATLESLFTTGTRELHDTVADLERTLRGDLRSAVE